MSTKKTTEFSCKCGQTCADYDHCKTHKEIVRPCGRSNPSLGDLPKKATATVCAGCDKRDATIKRQAEECDDLRHHGLFWRDRLDAEHECLLQCISQRDGLRSALTDIRAVCVDAGIEHADNMATLAAVRALSEKATDGDAACSFLERIRKALGKNRRVCELYVDEDGTVHVEIVDKKREPDMPNPRNVTALLALVLATMALCFIGHYHW